MFFFLVPYLFALLLSLYPPCASAVVLLSPSPASSFLTSIHLHSLFQSSSPSCRRCVFIASRSSSRSPSCFPPLWQNSYPLPLSYLLYRSSLFTPPRLPLSSTPPITFATFFPRCLVHSSCSCGATSQLICAQFADLCPSLTLHPSVDPSPSAEHLNPNDDRTTIYICPGSCGD
ncbi:hypothetical protein P691DRAFT_810721 [Macrolepiota fuliginosa MF-IS2]|uniref:Secreted protein n=1 Tax=Macrolepiota fuliginosa MF-IS2 TaxID=1400762 RepID=A0A9P5XI96_9AGAR|nr:hypothetical protein P691DRAFT_810721 [Macrolepiota fuliginosa MF-IS2]